MKVLYKSLAIFGLAALVLAPEAKAAPNRLKGKLFILMRGTAALTAEPSAMDYSKKISTWLSLMM
ncbi:hypothetical protein QFZ25_002433 [Bacillus atrophaeus]|nr:hypothetical protein [Bacillus atrophaeus]